MPGGVPPLSRRKFLPREKRARRHEPRRQGVRRAPDDERGVLILSLFAGASRERVDALIVNPYDVEQTAATMLLALRMPADEQRARMRNMQQLIQEFNVYRWAGRMLLDAARLHQRQRVQNRSAERGQVLQYRRA